MSQAIEPAAVTGGGFLSEVRPELRQSIVSGMRWTLWLYLLSVPFSYGTNILLGRVGPEALGTFGILAVYIAVVGAFFYIGGNPVLIKFLPQIEPRYQFSFVTSYIGILLVTVLCWLVLLSMVPYGVTLLFGRDNSGHLSLTILWLSPIYLTSLAVIATLRGLLQIKWAQTLDRAVIIGFFVTCAVLATMSPAMLAHQYRAVIWTTYLTLSGIVLLVGAGRILSVIQVHRIRVFLPTGFWHYTLTLQGSSVLSFVNSKLDFIFLLNAGGLSTLGKYVAITAICGIIPKVASFFVDSFLPSLATTLADNDLQSSQSLTVTYLRILFPSLLGLTLVLLLFVDPVLTFMGPEYVELGPLFILAVPIAAIQALNVFAASIFTATGLMSREIVIKLVRGAVFIITFWPLWNHYQLKGAVLAWALGEVIYQLGALYLLRSQGVVDLSCRGTYLTFGATLVLAGYAAKRLGAAGFGGAIAVGLLFMCAFLIVARYSVKEICALGRLIAAFDA